MFTSFKRTVIDIESNGLLNHLINFNKMPLRFKPEANIWCIVLTDLDNPTHNIILRQNDITRDALKTAFSKTTEIIAHNGIKFDFLFLKVFGIFDYKIYSKRKEDFNGEIFGNPVKIVDTLILSKLLNPDRFPGHSLKVWGESLSNYKDDYRQVCIDKGYISKDSPKGQEFLSFYEEVIPYCITDTQVTAAVYKELEKERGRFKVDDAFHMEMKLADLTVKQEFYGFKFDMKLAENSLEFLDNTLKDIQDKVNPILPPKLLNKGEQKDFIPPARQFKANGDFTSYLIKFIEKIEATVAEDKKSIFFENKEFPLPLDVDVCLKTTVESTIDDLDNLKAYLLNLGWQPIEWKERDLTKDSKKKILTEDKLDSTILRYVNNTLSGPYKNYRLNLLGVSEENLLDFLMKKRGGYSIRVPVSPQIRIGTDKQICANLEALGEKADFVKDVVQYLTYKHRRNSIAGSSEDEFGEPLTGYIAQVRVDGRVSTPADTNGASTTRYKHSGIANIPRTTSLFGEQMRGMFGPGDGRIQFGADFASLEAMVQGHFILPYKGGRELADSLIAEKPNDCFDKDTQILTKDGWINQERINKDTLIAQWSPISKNEISGFVSYTKPLDIIRRSHVGEMVTVKGDRLDMCLTPNHRVVLFNTVINKLEVVFAKDLKEYIRNNNECYIPSQGVLTEIENYLKENLSNVIIDHSEKDSGFVYKSTSLDAITRIATDQRLRGSSSLIIEKTNSKGVTIYQTIIGKQAINRNGFKLIFDEIDTIQNFEDDVWCVAVPSTFIIVKRNNKIYVSSNCHTKNAERLGITRNDAKSFGYACLPTHNTEVLTTSGWKYHKDLRISDSILSYNTELDIIEKDKIKGVVYFENKEVIRTSTLNNSFESTGDHRWFGINAEGVKGFFTTSDITENHSIISSAPLNKEYGRLTREELNVSVRSLKEVSKGRPNGIDWVGVVLSLPKELLTNFSENFNTEDVHLSNVQDAISLAKYLQSDITIYSSNQDLVKENLGVQPTFCLNTNNSTFIIRQNKEHITITGNCMYGAQASKLSKMLRVDEKEGQRLYDLYWEGVPALAKLKLEVEKFWESTGRSYILSIDGRKLLVRSKHSVVNLLFQSSGSLIMKYTAVELCQRLEELNLLGDPFEHEENAVKAFMMIVYHDEFQMSCHESMFNIHKFKSKDDITKKYSRSGAPSHIGNEYWVAEENTLSKIADESVDQVVKDFKLKVPLALEWQIGGNWAECH